MPGAVILFRDITGPERLDVHSFSFATKLDIRTQLRHLRDDDVTKSKD